MNLSQVRKAESKPMKRTEIRSAEPYNPMTCKILDLRIDTQWIFQALCTQEPTLFIPDNRCRNISRPKKKPTTIKKGKLKSPQTQPYQAIKVVPKEKLKISR